MIDRGGNFRRLFVTIWPALAVAALNGAKLPQRPSRSSTLLEIANPQSNQEIEAI
jgi:hypothetical protein